MTPDPITLTPPKNGVHQWLMRSCWKLRKSGLTEEEAAQCYEGASVFLRKGRKFNPNEVADVIEKVYGTDVTLLRSDKPGQPEYDERHLDDWIDENGMPDVAEWKSTSPGNPSYFDAVRFVRCAFRKDELICLGAMGKKGMYFETFPREDHEGNFNLIVPSPMAAAVGRKDDGKLSPRCLGNQPKKRRFYVMECDRYGADQHRQLAACLALLDHHQGQVQLAACVHSGGKSLHFWLRVDHLDEAAQEGVIHNAVKLGADPATRSKIQLVRLPWGWREKDVRQQLLWVDGAALRTD